MSRRAVLTTVTAPVPVESVFQSTMDTPVLTQGEQTYIDKVKELEERYAKPNKKKKKRKTKSKNRTSVKTITKKKKKQVKSPRKKAFKLSQVIKGRHGVPITKATTLRSLIRHVWWGRKSLMELLQPNVKLVDGQFLNKRTTLSSLMKQIPMSKVPLVDVVSNKIV